MERCLQHLPLVHGALHEPDGCDLALSSKPTCNYLALNSKLLSTNAWLQTPSISSCKRLHKQLFGLQGYCTKLTGSSMHTLDCSCYWQNKLSCEQLLIDLPVLILPANMYLFYFVRLPLCCSAASDARALSQLRPVLSSDRPRREVSEGHSNFSFTASVSTPPHRSNDQFATTSG